MAYEMTEFSIGCYPADVDMTNAQFRPVYLVTAANTTGYGQGGAAVSLTPNTAGTPLGIVQNNPQVGEAAHVMVRGVSKVKAVGTFAIDDPIGQGTAGVIKALSTKWAFGKAAEAAVTGDIATIILMPLGVQ